MQHPAHVTPVLFLQLRPEGNHHPEQEGIEIALEKEKSQESESDGQDCAHTFPTAHAEPVPARRVERRRQAGEQQDKQP